MATIVSFHAHPDDESIGTAGLLSLAADAGHRVVLAFATRGELGEPVPGVLAEGEQLSMRRTAECYESAAAIGAARVEFLGYTDSGMMGEATNDAPWCFWQVEVESAARRLAALLEEEGAEVLTVYDDHGGYGHPDHIQVHRVGTRAAEMAGTPVVVQSTFNRDLIRRSMAAPADVGLAEEEVTRGPDLPDDFGTPEAEITHVVDCTGVITRKRASMLAHASQIGPDHFMAAMPDEAFGMAFGREWFVVEPPPEPSAPAVFDEIFQVFSPD